MFNNLSTVTTTDFQLNKDIMHTHLPLLPPMLPQKDRKDILKRALNKPTKTK